MKNLPKIQSKWHDGKGNYFVVTDLKKDDTEIWVCYNKVGTENMYTVLVGAFLNRFTETP